MIDISHVNVGDRVKLTRENGDEATFTVTDTTYARNGIILSNSNRFDADDWDTLEVVERAFKPVPGLYSHTGDGHRVAVTDNGEVYFTHRDGAWVRVVLGGIRGTYEYNAVRELGGWKREVTF